MTYIAPITEIRFALDHVAGFSQLREEAACEELSDDLIDAILGEAARFAEGVLAPLNSVGDREGCRLENGVVRLPAGFGDAYRSFVGAGWPSLSLDPGWGGQGLPKALATAVGEIWTAANMAFALCPMLTRSAAELLQRHGSDALRDRLLPPLVAGQWTGTMLLTEPQAGTDLTLLRTQAVRDGEHYRLRGQKIFITYGDHDAAENIIHIVLARTPNAPPGLRGLSVFAVPKVLIGEDGSPGASNDVRCLSLERKLGLHASPTAVMLFGDAGGATAYLVGEEHRGVEEMFTMMNAARLGVGLEGVGIADHAYQLARAYAADRIQGRALGSAAPHAVAINRHADVQRMLLGMRAQAEAGRALAYYTAAMLDRAERAEGDAARSRALRRVGLLTPIVKATCTEFGIAAANTGIQVHGGYGYIEDSGAPQLLRDARVAAIYEGTNGIQALDLVLRKVIADGGTAMRELIGEVVTLAALLRGSTSTDLQVIGTRLRSAADDLTHATEWLLQAEPDGLDRVAAGASPYLQLAGTVIAGWLMAKAASVAQSDGCNVPSGFARSKLRTTRFYADSFLGGSVGLLTQVRETANSLADIDPERDF